MSIQAGVIPLREDYNIHFFDSEFIFQTTTQIKGLVYNVDEILKKKARDFLPPSVSGPLEVAIKKVLITGESEWLTYALGQYDFLALIDKVEEKTVAVHVVFDNVHQRDSLKKRLWVASGNLYKDMYKGDVG